MGLTVIFSLPEGYNGKDGSYFHLHVYIPLHCHTIAQILYKVVCKQYQSYCEHLHMYRCVHSISNKGRIRWDVKYCIVGNFARYFCDWTPSHENFFPWKFLPPKLVADKLRKLTALPLSLISRDSTDPNYSYKHWANCGISLIIVTYDQLAFHHHNCKWIFGVSMFPLEWQFIANSYPHALITSLLQSLQRCSASLIS